MKRKPRIYYSDAHSCYALESGRSLHLEVKGGFRPAADIGQQMSSVLTGDFTFCYQSGVVRSSGLTN